MLSGALLPTLGSYWGLLWVLNDPWPLMGQLVWPLLGSLMSGRIENKKRSKFLGCPHFKVCWVLEILFTVLTSMFRMKTSWMQNGQIEGLWINLYSKLGHTARSCHCWSHQPIIGYHFLRVDIWHSLPSNSVRVLPVAAVPPTGIKLKASGNNDMTRSVRTPMTVWDEVWPNMNSISWKVHCQGQAAAL